MTIPPVWKRTFLSQYLVLALTLAWLAVVLPTVPGMSSPGNLGNLVSSSLPLLVVAVGQTLVMVTGGIDLSVTAIISLASTCGALALTTDQGWLGAAPWALPAGIALMLLIGVAIGLCNGLAIAALRVPPFIITLTAMMLFSGYAVWMTHSRNIYHLPSGFTAIGKQTSWSLLVTLGIAGGAHLLLRRTLLGRWLYAVGSNSRAARVSGVPAPAVVVSAYVLSGLCGAVAAILYTGRLETGSPVLGQRILLDVIGAVVIGGTSLFGGRGQILWTVFGVLFMTVIDNSLNLLGLSNFSVLIAKGLVILLAALLDRARQQYASL